MKREYDLIPADGHKSFYGKAHVTVNDDGTETLWSYRTMIMARRPDGTLERYYIGPWSATTGRHIRAFCGLNKAEFLSLPVKPGTGTWDPNFIA